FSCRTFPIALRIGFRLALLFGAFWFLRRVIGFVESGPLELDGRRRNQLAQRAAAFRAMRVRRIRKLLQDFDPLLTLLALVFVQRHALTNSGRMSAIPLSARPAG